MLRAFGALLFAVGLAFIAHAQVPMTGAGLAKPGGSPPPSCSYTGIGDVVSGAKGYYGLRAYNAASCGNKVAQVCNAGDAACVDMVSSSTTGALVITTVGGTNCAVSTCTVKTLYDQSGALACSSSACDATQATEADRPTLVVNCTGASKPCLDFGNNTSIQLQTPSMAITAALPQSFLGYTKKRTTVSNNDLISYCNGGLFWWSNNNDLAVWNGGSVIDTAATAAFHRVQAVIASGGGAVTFDVDGTTVSPGATGGTQTCNASQLSIGNGSGTGTFQLSESAIYAIAFNGTQLGNIDTNMSGYW
jgi:hypothetical protein